MGNKRNVIEINGRRYDAATGKPVSADPSQVVKKVHKIASGPPSKSSVKRTKRAAGSVHSKTKKSTTLNRAATRKPATKKSATPAKSMEIRKSTPISRDGLTRKVNAKRQLRAQAQATSPAISKFAAPKTQAVTKPVAVPAPPAQQAVAAAEPAHIAPAQTSEKERLIAEQLAKAHDEPAEKSQPIRAFFRRRPKLVTILATSAATLLVIGYVTYLNIPNMALRVAASRAGFEANMPGYSPNGFSFGGPIAYSPGQITIEFNSNTDDRYYTITERETNWDSQSLLENYVKPETDLYSTFQERGLTVYVYDTSSAAWVNGGVWYTIEGDSLLNSEQLLKIATSL